MVRESVTASAPSQAFLLGEHAVLYGSPALALSVDRRSYSTASPLEKGNIVIESELGRYEERRGKVVGYNDDLAKLSEGVKILLGKYEIDSGVHLRIRSEVPIGSGMASSASVAAAVSKSIDGLFDLGLNEKELLEAVYAFEKIIHGKASKTGPACAVLGGVIWVEWVGEEMRAGGLGHMEVPITIACTGEPSPTKQMVESVARLRDMIPSAHTSIVRAISEIVGRGRVALREGDLETLGRLMNLNQGLLYALGVSSWAIEQLVWAARRKGALGAKLSGAGGGGCVIVLHEEPDKMAKELGPITSLAFPVRVAREGVRIERG
ncbi:MAG: mevalonate kinase [Candidatus Korarchaeota archaeon]|nr:mevalonate kinase [Candidatus Korarchaeota archaeon]